MILPLLFSISAWIPYATEARGIPDLAPHISEFTNISPFVYDITGTSTITDEGGVSKGNWSATFSSARADGVEIFPTLVWGNPDEMHTVLSNPQFALAHIASIVSIAKQNNFDGIDIDYEGMYPSDRIFFTQFLAELSTALHANGKTLVCTVEAKASEYQNIANACDQVRIMAYDKYYYDFTSNSFSTTTPLTLSVTNAPLSFDKIAIAAAEKYIPASRIILGIPTYGYDFSYSIHGVTRSVARYATYSYTDTIALAQSVAAKVYTTAQDEKYFLYASKGVNHFVVFSDSKTLSDRLALAKSLGIGGVAIFKIDGKEDPAIWNALTER